MSNQVSLNSATQAKPKLFHLLLRPIIVFILSAPIIALLLSVETTPSLVTEQQITTEELSRIETLLLESTPQTPNTPSQQEFQLNAQELNLLLRYVVNVMNLSPDWAAELALDDQLLHAQVSARVSRGLVPLFLNIEAIFSEDDNLLKLNSLKLGKISVPDRFLQYTLNQLRENLASGNTAYLDFSELINNVESVKLSEDQMNLVLYWDPTLISRIGNQTQQFFISDLDQQRIIDYYSIISDIVATVPIDIKAVSINTFLLPLFTAAHEKSLAGSDPIAENRTLFQTLAIYLNQEPIDQLIGAELAANLEPVPFIETRLQRRQDLAQHLISIAAVTASAGADLAQMLSTTKEAYDARYRSGFSFSDLTANTVGVTMGRFSTATTASALLMQGRLANLQSESDYMPEVGNNRDGLSESDFNAMYTDRNSPEYQQRLTEIQRLIDSRPLFLDLPQVSPDN